MRSMSRLFVLCLFLLLGTLTTAWPWRPHGEMLQRAAESATTGAAATTESASKTDSVTKAASATGTGTSVTGTGTGTQATTQTGTATGKTSTGSHYTNTSSISINPAAGAGGISMLTPTEGATSYYRIGDYVTLAWNYTSLTISPTAVNVVASCSLNSATYTISTNMTMGPTGKVIWDTRKYQANATVPLLTASYTLIVWDASKALTETASAGYLSAASGYTFGMYSSQPYTPLNGFVCATCSSAFSELERMGLKFTMGMVTITILSFTWFAGGSGVFST
ncbi:hypothetical protein BO94DRAFT_330667 [Aspergillus sclerotioniger CBS 115572]|uniref:DUF7137 domain-containing protein n=1 Tax=Aspergillus sclerotioniger CBS 115572 TaxID=1450535 RepID=A0A317V1Z7_9EURO|nr:hypothetical protein BO94DRAFT_330667 [Aspergillus sclerotioniger CBS 115572]PWY66827.1 hypothetical protein BO94DRAFT_330667 [Aspergillus sclerotioniger CBS 115572]